MEVTKAGREHHLSGEKGGEWQGQTEAQAAMGAEPALTSTGLNRPSVSPARPVGKPPSSSVTYKHKLPVNPD